MAKGETGIVNQQYELVVGLEVHVELNAKSKMFCRCSTDYFGQAPNTHTCPVCLGLPGAVPFANEEALKSCIKIGLALNCQVAELSRFERKNYFYPDLPKGYQISQYRWPLCVDGWLDVEGSEGMRRIRINRVHQEEDTGKLTHLKGSTAIDFNRSGVPLVEIVTEPDFHDVEAVVEYAKKLQQIFRYLGVSNADMEQGDMRLEANVSIRPASQTKLPNYRVELKNINSFRFMKAAIQYEIDRQIKALEAGEKLSQETRGWNEDKKMTYLQRSKEEARDYRYFPDPDLPELRMKSEELIIKNKIPEMPWVKEKRFAGYGLSGELSRVLSEDREYSEHFEKTLQIAFQKNISASVVARKYTGIRRRDLDKYEPEKLVAEIKEEQAGRIEDEEQIRQWAEEVITENQKSTEDYKNGKEAAIQALIGGVMRRSGGKANAGLALKVLKKLLSK